MGRLLAVLGRLKLLIKFLLGQKIGENYRGIIKTFFVVIDVNSVEFLILVNTLEIFIVP